MSNATLTALHDAVAKMLLEIVTEGVPVKWDDAGEVIAMRPASAAELGAAITLLKNNSITAVIEESDALTALQAAMAAKRKKARPVLPDYLSDAPLQ